ncbi:MAG: Co2+/Mg2+ efflux protein ApaG [Bacteroidetes bacterium]|nr:Co2+/Mg2+ efflux protein ApaG [Bacteroidota bacterium]
METLTTAGVEIRVETFYQFAESNSANGEFIHSYRITISNHNAFTVQLLRRKWVILDSYRELKTVEGEGVVGRQPILYPGDSYEYVSGCNLQSPIGRMDGIYIFQNKQSGKEFEVKVPVFRLEAPEILN